MQSGMICKISLFAIVFVTVQYGFGQDSFGGDCNSAEAGSLYSKYAQADSSSAESLRVALESGKKFLQKFGGCSEYKKTAAVLREQIKGLEIAAIRKGRNEFFARFPSDSVWKSPGGLSWIGRFNYNTLVRCVLNKAGHPVTAFGDLDDANTVTWRVYFDTEIIEFRDASLILRDGTESVKYVASANLGKCGHLLKENYLRLRTVGDAVGRGIGPGPTFRAKNGASNSDVRILQKPRIELPDAKQQEIKRAEPNGFAMRVRVVFGADKSIKRVSMINADRFGIVLYVEEAVRNIDFIPAVRDGMYLTSANTIAYNISFY